MSGVGLGGGSWTGSNPITNGSIIRGIAAMASGPSSFSVTYPSSIGTTSYVLQLTISNVIDASPRHLTPNTTAKSATGFSFATAQTTDTANYKIEYMIIKL
jgi:hypothetical protein